MQCPNINRCPLFPLFRLKASLKTWQINYCDADFARCERYKHAQRGEIPPRNLLPNGAFLPDEAPKDGDAEKEP